MAGGDATTGNRPGTAETAANSTTAIDVRGLSLTFQAGEQAVHALSDIDLTIERGEFVSLIGPSGCGKTTLMRVIADLEQPTDGKVSVFDDAPRQARLDRVYGYVFQAPTLQAWRTVERNIELPLEIMGMPVGERRKRSRSRLEMVGLNGFETKYPWQLSGGMQQRVSIARALSFDPDLLLMDEPFGALDEITRDHLNEELLTLWAKTGKTVIFVTHSIAEAVFLSTKIVVMSRRPGRIIEVIDCNLPVERDLTIRDAPEFLDIAAQVRRALRDSHSYDD